jgi:hypothetical protein
MHRSGGFLKEWQLCDAVDAFYKYRDIQLYYKKFSELKITKAFIVTGM